jgi:glucokinase
MYLGIEIGGTKLQLGLGAGDGRLAALWRGPVDAAAGADGIRRQILAAAPALLRQAGIEQHDVQAIGVGFGGPVDDATATVIKSHQIADWDDFPLARWIEGILGRPVVLGNDADVAGLGEALFGAGRGVSPVFYITIGSGIGGGLIIDGRIYRGTGRGAAEIGHLMIAGGLPLEEFASGWAIQQQARKLAADARHAASPLHDLAARQPHALTAQHVADAARAGDKVARRILDDAWNHLALAISHVLALLCPRRVIIGGGVSLMGDLLFTPLRDKVAAYVFKPFAGCYEIVPAALGEEVVVHGALALARQRFSEVSR